MATNTPTAFPGFTVVSGMSTAYSAPASTSYIINNLSIVMNDRTGTAGAVSAAVRFAFTGSAGYTIVPYTGITAGNGLQFNGVITIPPGHCLLFSANSGSGLDVVAFGLVRA